MSITYRLLRFTSGIGFWLRRHLSRPGLTLAIAVVVAAAVGVDTRQTVAYQAFCFGLALLAVSAVAARFLRGAFDVSRGLPTFVTSGEPFTYRLKVRNESRHGQRDLVVIEDLADPRPSYEEYTAAIAAGGRTGFDYVWPRRYWRRLVNRSHRATVAPTEIADLAAGAEQEVRISVLPRRRGYLRFTGTTLARSDPLGLFRALFPAPGPQTLLVLPKRYELPELDLPGTRTYQPGGVTLAASVGESEEFVSLRDYRPGDPLQRIHWKSYARAGKPMVKEYQDEFFERHALVLDTFLPPGHTDLGFEEAVSVAASFACTIETQDSLLDLVFVGAEVHTFTAGRAQLQTEDLLGALAAAEICRDRPFASLGEAILARADTLSSCILVLVAWDDERRALVDRLHLIGIPLRVLVVADPAEPPESAPDWLTRLTPGQVQEGLANL